MSKPDQGIKGVGEVITPGSGGGRSGISGDYDIGGDGGVITGGSHGL